MSLARLSRPRNGADWVRTLGPFGWAVILIGGAIGFLVNEGHGDAPQTITLIALSIFFAVMITRMLLAIFFIPRNRSSLIPLLVGIALWAVASAGINANDQADPTQFPAPGEWMFISAYVAFAAFLVLDANGKSGKANTAWLDAAIVCGAMAAAASAVLLTPFSVIFPEGGIPLLAAILYPLIDVALAVVVLGQWALGSRPWSWRTCSLILGFVALAIADSSLVLNLSTGAYTFSIAIVLVFGAAFMLISSAAVTPRPQAVMVAKALPGVFLVVSFLGAIALLILRPEGSLGLAMALPAAITLLATGARLVLALRDSRTAGEAIHMAQTDDLTGLPNRRAILQKLDERIARGEPLGLMLLDLDGFKEVNDTLGHSAGDTLLELVALRMREALPNDITLARIGGDEFAILVHTDDQIELMERAQAIRTTLLAPAKVDGLDLAMHASVGITVREPEDVRAADLLRRADVAMYEAKVTRAGAQLYDAERDEFSRQRLRMGEELRRGLQKGHVTVWYQPKIDAVTQLAVGVEALVRWEHPERGMVPPMAFLSVARRAGLMQELSEVVAKRAVADAVKWRKGGLDLNVAINLAPPELLSGKLMPVLYDALAKADLPNHFITIEVTEDTFLADPERARESLLDVRRHGLKTSIDDYGTGFSSLAYLRDLPVIELKMDRSFVSTVCTDDRSRLIVMSTIDMAHALDLRVVAEGVESAAVTAEVVAMGVDVLQGYYVSPPMPGDALENWVRNWNAQAIGATTTPHASWRDSGAAT